MPLLGGAAVWGRPLGGAAGRCLLCAAGRQLASHPAARWCLRGSRVGASAMLSCSAPAPALLSRPSSNIPIPTLWPAPVQDMERLASSGGSTLQVDLERLSGGFTMLAISPIGSPSATGLIPLAPPPPSIKAAMAGAGPAVTNGSAGPQLGAFYGHSNGGLK